MERERLLLSCLRREGLGDPEELLELELREVLELPERLEAEEELEPLLVPVLELDPELEVELERDLLGGCGGGGWGRIKMSGVPRKRMTEKLLIIRERATVRTIKIADPYLTRQAKEIHT